MKYATIKYNDIANAPGISVSVYLQGCPHHCPGCFNPNTWDFDGGIEFTPQVLDSIINGIVDKGIKRSLCILGGEPMCDENLFLTHLIISSVKEKHPDTPIYIWSGYTYEELLKKGGRVNQIFELADVLIDGPFIESLKDLTLELRGSSNQRIIYLHKD